jgi:hypothetical protein
MSTRRLFVALFAIALIAVAVRETLDPDMWWHLRTGELILEQGLPRQDAFSFTVQEHEWITHEWLSQVFMWGIFRVARLPGLMISFALLVALSFWIVYACSPGRPYLAAFVALLGAFTSAVVWGARPQIFNLLLTATFVHIVERYKDRTIPQPALWLLPLMSILWANLHSGYLLGIVLLGTYVVGEALQRWLGQDLERTLEWPQIRQLTLVTVVAFLLAALNPNGVELWVYPFLTLGSAFMQTYIMEWHSPDFHLSVFWPFGLTMATGIVSWLFSPKRPAWSEGLLFVGTAAAGLLSARHIPLFSIVAVPIISRHLLFSSEGTRFFPLLSGKSAAPSPTRMVTLLNLVVIVLVLFAAGLWIVEKVAGNEAAIAERYPADAVEFLERNGLAAKRGYNSYNWGGYLIWQRLPVFVDGRADVYGDEFLTYYRKSYGVEEDWQRPLDEFSVDYVLMEQGSPLSVLLITSEQWREAYADDVAQVFVRNDP